MPNVPGPRWQDRRAELDIDQASAAEALGIQKRTLQNIETNPRQNVSLEVIWRASRLYNVSASWLKGVDVGEGETPPQPTPEPKPQREPAGDPAGPPARRNGRHDRRGPARSADTAATGAA